MKKICIAGDSWSQGVWRDPAEGGGLMHEGLTAFLKEKHHVINTGSSGSSNEWAYTSLRNEIVKSGPFDYIFWFFTDPIRDFRIEKYSILHTKNVTFESILEAQHQQTIKAFENFNSLGVPIYCMGGTVRLNLDLIKNYSNLIPFIPCISEYLEPDYEHPIIWQSDWLHGIGRQFDLESLDKFVIEKRKQDNLRSFETHFWPDGGHPNYLGHYKIYQKICKNLNL
jgi:hypothetical protein